MADGPTTARKGATDTRSEQKRCSTSMGRIYIAASEVMGTAILVNSSIFTTIGTSAYLNNAYSTAAAPRQNHMLKAYR